MAVTCTYVTELNSTANASSYAFNATSIGPAATGRIVVVAVHQSTSASPNTASASLTINGVSASLAGSAQIQDATMVEIFYLVVNSGTTADIVVNSGEAQQRAAIGVWAVYGANPSPTDTDGAVVNSSATISITALTVPAGGCGIIAVSNASPGSAAISWTNATERYDDYFESAFEATGADTTTAGTNTITAAGGPNRDKAMAGVAFGPSGASITADAGSYSLTGQAAGFLRGKIIFPDAASYSMSGTATATLHGWEVAAAAGAYALTGQAASLNLSSGVSNYILAAAASSYLLAGTDAGTFLGREVVATSAAYAFTGMDATPTYTSRRITAEMASYQITGASVSLTYGTTDIEVGGQWVGDYDLPYVDVDGEADVASASGSASRNAVSGDANAQTISGEGIKYRVNRPH